MQTWSGDMMWSNMIIMIFSSLKLLSFLLGYDVDICPTAGQRKISSLGRILEAVSLIP